MKNRVPVACVLLASGAASAFAQATIPNTAQRDVNQQTRTEAQANKDGQAGKQEQAFIQGKEDHRSKRVFSNRHNKAQRNG